MNSNNSGLRFYIEKQEALEIVLCVIAISIALAIAFIGLSVLGNVKTLVFLTGFFAVTVGSGFILHEMAHKVVAIFYGAYARFRMWPAGLALMFVLAIVFGIVFAAPGAVYIYAHNITRKQNGLISIAGPATNMAIAAVFLLLAKFAPVYVYSLLIFNGNLWLFGAYINTLLAFFNMIPIMPLDGAKVKDWNFWIWITGTAIAFSAWIFTGGFL